MVLLLVEDEPYTREGIVGSIDWDEIGIDRIYMAENGAQGLQMARLYSPDIVLADMRMPKMDGSDMAKEIKKILPRCHFIFISGFSERVYYKTALHVSALDYISKPLDIEELKTVLAKAVDLVKDAHNKQEHLSILENNELATYIIQDNNNIDKNELINLWKQYGMPYGQDHVFYTLFLKNESPHFTLKAIYEAAQNSGIKVVAGIAKAGYIIHVAIGKNSDSEKRIIQYSTKLLKELQDKTSCLGIGVQVDSPEQLGDSYYSAISSYGQKFYHPGEKLFISSKTSLSLDIGYDPAYELSKILLQSPENAKKWVQNQFEHIRKHDATPVELVRYWGFKMSAELYFLLNSLRNADISNNPEDDAALWKAITSFESLDDLRDYIMENLDNLENSRSSLDQSLPMSMEVQRYIHLNCSEPLTLEMISQHVNLSVTYLCSIFKDATGKTINEYITDCRIHRAKRFLETTNMHINEIALASGYSSSSYFIKAFKKSTSVTPHEYRLAYKVV